MLFYAAYKDPDGNEHAGLYENLGEFSRATFSPACEILAVIGLRLSGKTYQERKAAARSLAIEYSLSIYPGLSWGESARVSTYFENIGKRYGLLKEFRENAIC